MSDYREKLLEALGEYLSSIHARAILSRALDATGVGDRELTPSDLHKIVERIDRSVRLFVPPERLDSLRSTLRTATAISSDGPDPEVVEVRREADIIRARSRAREMCILLGGTRTTVQKAATIVSELARNITSYTTGGVIELIPQQQPLALLIRSEDRGPGIRNLDEIMSGSYRSRTGLGMGILGSKRLSDRFSIDTDASGTRIEAEVRL